MLYGPQGEVLPGTSAGKRKDESYRLLVCYDCFTIDKLVPYKGREDEHGRYLDTDPALEYVIERYHTDRASGEKHRGRLLRCDEKTWNSIDAKMKISKEVFKDQADRVQLRDGLTADAMECFNKHNRPKDGCIDFRDGSKRLPSPVTGRVGATSNYLCDMCPVTHGVVLPELRRRAGFAK